MHSLRSADDFKGDALPEVAKAIARKCRVLCLDEVTIYRISFVGYYRAFLFYVKPFCGAEKF